MKRSYKFSNFLRLKEIEAHIVPIDYHVTVVKPQYDSGESLIKIVFARDHTMLPVSDLETYLSPKANPEVKKFILDNLLMDVSSAAAPKLPAGLDDDAAFALMRQSGESFYDYAARVNQFGREHSDLAFGLSNAPVE